MKALVLSGGRGSRLRPITYSCAKQLIPVANRPILFYVLDDIAKAGIKEVGIVVGETKEHIKAAVGKGQQWGINVTYIEQESPLGLAHAVKISEKFIDNEPFVMYLGDNLLKGGIKSFINEYGNKGEDINILLAEVKHPEQFGVAELDGEGKIKRLVEKPVNFLSNKALVGIYIFNHKIFSAVKNIKPSWREELEITDAIQYVIDHGGQVRSYLINKWWKDTGKTEDVLAANELMMGEMSEDNQGYVTGDSQIKGKVNIACNSYIKDSIIEGPVIIGDNCLLEDAYIGPYTSIGQGVQIINAAVTRSIIMEETIIIDIKGKITDSLIGRGVTINGYREKAGRHILLLGDRCNLELNE